MTISNNLTVGVEVEYPRAQDSAATFDSRGLGSYDLHEELAGDRYGTTELFRGADVTYDGTVGTEVVSEQLSVGEAPNWYGEVLYEMGKYEPHEPTGLLDGRGSTAGLHIHMSPLTMQKARRLAEVSQEPFMQVFACTSITEDNQTVFRDNYCSVGEFDESRYSVVHSCPGNGHWEWRLPEPMTLDNFELLMKFLDKFNDDADDAIRWARKIVSDGDDRLTSIERGKTVGIGSEDLETETPRDPSTWSVSRTPAMLSETSSEFFRDVEEDTHAPYIYHVTDDNGGDYFAFYTNRYDLDETFEAADIEYTVTDVLEAQRLAPIHGEQRALVREAVEDHRRNISTAEKSEATDLLSKVIKE